MLKECGGSEEGGVEQPRTVPFDFSGKPAYSDGCSRADCRGTPSAPKGAPSRIFGRLGLTCPMTCDVPMGNSVSTTYGFLDMALESEDVRLHGAHQKTKRTLGKSSMQCLGLSWDVLNKFHARWCSNWLQIALTSGSLKGWCGCRKYKKGLIQTPQKHLVCC